jgi:hypothetical protein
VNGTLLRFFYFLRARRLFRVHGVFARFLNLSDLDGFTNCSWFMRVDVQGLKKLFRRVDD